ncbi:hypothetical protein ACVIHA_002206 [Bradyrhizobium liaoningense]
MIGATLIVASLWAVWANVAIPPVLIGATVLIALVGFADDIKSLPMLVRLVLQAACVGAVVFTAPETARIVPALPLALERGLIVLAGVWFVNLVNFMDGLDLMTVAEVVPVTAALLLLGMLGDLSWPAVLIAAALCGAMLGFAPFNRPGRKGLLGRCRQPADRPLARLVPAGARLPGADGRSAAVARLLSCGFHHHAVPAHHQARTVLVGTPHAFLSACNRQRVHGEAGGRRGIRAQSRTGIARHRHHSRRFDGRYRARAYGGNDCDRRRAAPFLPASGDLKVVKRRSSRIPELHPSGWS